MKNRLIISSIFVFLLTISTLQAQIYHKGTLHLSKGKVKEVYIEIDFGFPQRFQQGITYVEPKDWAKAQKTGKLKNKMKQKMEPKHFDSFTLEDGREFRTVWYADLTGKAIKMIPKRMTLEVIADGEIELYKLYSRTTGKINGELADYVMGDRQTLIDYIQNNFQLLIRKDSKNPKNVMHINLLNYIGDNARVKDNYDNNYYGLRNQFSEEHKMGRYVGKVYEAAFLRMLNDYNQEAQVTK